MLPTGGKRKHYTDTVHDCTRMRRFLPAGPLVNGGYREHDLIQFYARDGGIRTAAIRDLDIVGIVKAKD